MRRIKQIRKVKTPKQYNKNLQVIKSYKYKNVHVIQTHSSLKFTNLKDGTAWSLTKKNDTASNINANGYKIEIGFPKVSQVIYPKQTVRLNTGWNVDQLPTQTMMHTLPHKALIQNNIVGMPQIMDQSDQGGQLVQIIMNNSQYPIRITLNSDPSEPPRVTLINPQTLAQQLQFDPLNLIQGVLGAACHILPFFG